MQPDPLILAFDTSAAHCAAALLSGDRLVQAVKIDMKKGQVEHLMPILQTLLQDNGLDWPDLTALGVGIGPGNFTGIRISVAAARGLSLSLGIKAIGVSSLSAQAFGTDGIVVSSLDARQDRLYVQVLNDMKGQDPALCDLATLPPIPAETRPTCIGHMAEAIAERCAGKAAPAACPLAVAIGRIALSRMDQDLPSPSPLYLRPADAKPSSDPAPVILP